MPHTAAPASALVLFDIDGTLIRRAGPHHKEALVKAIRRRTGRETSLEGFPTQGMLDRDLIRAMLRSVGASRREIELALPEIVVLAQRIYTRTCPDLQRTVCPGARRLLLRLKKAGIPTGLVTGNLTAIGRMKMKRAGLLSYFQVGAFAEMAQTRAGLVKLAIREALATALIHRNAQIALIGDHMNDVSAAKMNGIRSIAVGTGVATQEQLAALGPDVIVPDLRSLTFDALLPSMNAEVR